MVSNRMVSGEVSSQNWAEPPYSLVRLSFPTWRQRLPQILSAYWGTICSKLRGLDLVPGPDLYHIHVHTCRNPSHSHKNVLLHKI